MAFYGESGLFWENGFDIGQGPGRPDGRASVMGEFTDCPGGRPKGVIVLEFVESNTARSYVEEAWVSLQIPRNGNCTLKGMSVMNTLLHRLFPNWRDEAPSRVAWIREGMRQKPSTATTVQRGGLEVALRVSGAMRPDDYYILSVRPGCDGDK